MLTLRVKRFAAIVFVFVCGIHLASLCDARKLPLERGRGWLARPGTRARKRDASEGMRRPEHLQGMEDDEWRRSRSRIKQT